jgi:hypothetical protein
MSDINGGVYPNGTGSPIFAGTLLTGPVLAGNVQHSDGSGSLAGAGETSGTANVGYTVMAQSQQVTQATNGASPGVYTSTIVIPAQSQILSIIAFVSTAFSGAATTFGVGNSASATAYTAASAVVTSGALGKIIINPGTGATQIANWINVGNTDVQIVLTSTNTGTGVATITVEYIQGINLANS